MAFSTARSRCRSVLVAACLVGVISFTVTPSSSTASSWHSVSPLHAVQFGTFGMGCFWKPSEEILKLPGVIDTVVGYTGRSPSHPKQEPPTYEAVCFSRDWVEGVRVYYDDTQMSYQDVLEAFFQHQEPKPGSRQYGSYIFPTDDQQRQQAKEWLERDATRVREDGVPIQWTQIEEPTPFWKAEEYHQQYWQKFRPRIIALVLLTATSSGILDRFTPDVYQSSIHTGANAVALAGCFYSLIERRIDTKTVLLE